MIDGSLSIASIACIERNNVKVQMYCTSYTWRSDGRWSHTSNRSCIAKVLKYREYCTSVAAAVAVVVDHVEMLSSLMVYA